MSRNLFLLLLTLPLQVLASGGGSALSRLRGGGGIACEAALFDFDGTLAQSEPLHRLAFSEVLGVEIEEEEWETKCVGTSPAKVMADRLPDGRLAAGETIDDLLAQRSAVFERWIDDGKLEATQALELLEDSQSRASVAQWFRRAVARTSSASVISIWPML